MSDVHTFAMDRAIALLTAAGAKYAIVMPDGTKRGTLELAPEHAPRRKVNNFVQYGYKEKIDALEAGGSAKIETPAGHRIGDWLSVLSGYGRKRFGAGNFITAQGKDMLHVEVFRVA